MDGFAGKTVASLLSAGVLALATSAWTPPAQASSGRVTAHASASTVLVRSKVTLTGVATPVRGQVALQRLVAGRWSTVSHAAVTASGSYTLSLPVSRNAKTWTVRVKHAAATSPTLTVHVVEQAFTVHTSAPLTLPVGRQLTVTGTISPPARGTVRLQQWRGGTWTTVASASVTPTSAYRLHLIPSAGVIRLRVVSPASTTRAAGASQPFAVAVQVAPGARVTQQPDPAPVTDEGPPLPAPPAEAPVVTTEQNSTYGNAGNTDALSGVGLSGLLQETWADGVVGDPSSVVFGDGVVFVSGNADAHAFVTGLRASDGSVLWGPYLLPGNDGRSMGTLAYDAGRVFVVSGSGTVAAFDAASGTLDWSTPTVGPGGGEIPIASGGRLYLGAVAVLDEATGASLWGVNAAYDWGPAAVAGDKVAVNGGDLMPGIIDAATGKVLWAKPYTNVSSGHTAAIAGGKVYAQSVDSHTGTVYDLATGRQTGTYASDEPPAVDAANDVMVTATADDPHWYVCGPCTVHGRSLSTGRSLWQFTTPDGGVEPPLIVDGVVYLVDGGVIYALDEHTGALISSMDVHVQTFTGDHSPEAAPVIAAGDGLLVVPVDGGLVALQSSSLTETAPVQEHEVTAYGDCPDERDAVFVSRTCTWVYPQLASGSDTLQLLWNVDRRATITASVQDSSGHVYGTQTSSTGMIQLTTTRVAAGGTVQVAVTDSGPDGGANYVSDFAGAEPHASVPPTATPSTNALGFGYVPLGTASSESFTVRNTGGSDLLISTVTLNDPSSVTYSGEWDTCSGTVLPAGWSCTLRVAAHPQSKATVTGSVVVSTAGAPAVVTLSAAGD